MIRRPEFRAGNTEFGKDYQKTGGINRKNSVKNAIDG